MGKSKQALKFYAKEKALPNVHGSARQKNPVWSPVSRIEESCRGSVSWENDELKPRHLQLGFTHR